MKKRAYISVSDKENIVDFAKKLIENKFEIVSTGGTYNLLKENKLEAKEVSQITGFSEMLNGKVKSPARNWRRKWAALWLTNRDSCRRHAPSLSVPTGSKTNGSRMESG
jgi:hypothetical protein